MNVYMDFHSTLFDTIKIRNILQQKAIVKFLSCISLHQSKTRIFHSIIHYEAETYTSLNG